MAKLVSRNPATGAVLQELAVTDETTLPAIFERARAAQLQWAAAPIAKRAACLLQIREVLINRSDEITALISAENGKPRFEALTNEVIPTADLLTYFARRAPKILANRRVPLQLLKHRKSYLNYWPLGVVAVISPWNYPFLLPFGNIAMALVAGNAVIFKPSEITPMIGLKIQEICDLAGLPPDLIQTMVGDGALGAALVRAKPDKIFFTGSVTTGKRIMASAAENLTPVNLELGGKDAMLVLPDADLDFATSAALWGGFSNSGQMCASVERILVHQDQAAEFTRRLGEKLALLREGAPDQPGTDLGVITFDRQKEVYERHLAEARQCGALIASGGEFSADRTRLKPTIVAGADVESLLVYNEETFGPIVALTTYKSVAEAIRKANRSRYGLTASVITRDLSLGEEVARQLEVGTVTINEVAYTAGLPETPWGGIKESGLGRTHADLGLYEFAHLRHIHRPRSRLFVFKSLWWFPYSPFQYEAFRSLLGIYRRSWADKLRAASHFIWNLAQSIKLEKRL